MRTIRMPTDGTLRFRAGKTKKWAEFQVNDSPILSGLVQRRLAMKAHSVMLLTTNTGRQVSERMLTDRWDDARSKAAKVNPDLAEAILAMYNGDMRKRAADLAGDQKETSRLLQHSDTKLTQIHYRIKAEKLKAVR